MAARAGKITIQDIAREAGVSKTAASFYINGKAKLYNLADETCARIERVVQRHNYTPNMHARAINSGRTFMIGVVVEMLARSFWMDIIEGIEEAIEKREYHMALSVSHYDAERETEVLDFLDRKGVDGYIHAPVLSDTGVVNQRRISALRKKKPVVSIIAPLDGIPSVYNDNEAGGRVAAEHLLEMGHRKIAYVGTMKRFDTRGVGFAAVLRENGVTPAVFGSVDAFLESRGGFTAVFCHTDYLLMELYGKAEKLGVSIPGDLSAIGYDNMDFVRLLNPSPTTIHQFKKELGVAAGELLMQILHGEKPEAETIKFTPRLAEGKSVRRL